MTEHEKRKKIWTERITENIWYILLVVFAGTTTFFVLPAETLGKLGIGGEGLDQLFGFGANISFTCLGLVIFRVSAVLMFPGWDLAEFRKTLSTEGRAKLMAAILLAIAFIIGSGMSAYGQEPPHLQLARKYLYVREKTGNNDSPEIDRWCKNVGIPLRSSYCAAYVSECLTLAKATTPNIRSGVARRFVIPTSIEASRVHMGDIPPGTLIIWQRGTGWQGHIGIVIRQLSATQFETIEANTSSGNTGSQANGDGVYIRRRTTIRTAYFRITHFTRVGYA